MEETGDDVSSTRGERKKDDDGMDEAEGLHAIQGEGRDIGGGQPSGRLDNEKEAKEETGQFTRRKAKRNQQLMRLKARRKR